MLKKRIVLSLQQKKTSNQEMQISTESDTKNNENMSMNNYDKFMNKITAAFESVNLKRETEWKFEYLKQKESVFIYMTDFR